MERVRRHREKGEDDIDSKEEVCEEIKYRLDVPVDLEACGDRKVLQYTIYAIMFQAQDILPVDSAREEPNRSQPSTSQLMKASLYGTCSKFQLAIRHLTIAVVTGTLTDQETQQSANNISASQTTNVVVEFSIRRFCCSVTSPPYIGAG